MTKGRPLRRPFSLSRSRIGVGGEVMGSVAGLRGGEHARAGNNAGRGLRTGEARHRRHHDRGRVVGGQEPRVGREKGRPQLNPPRRPCPAGKEPRKALTCQRPKIVAPRGQKLGPRPGDGAAPPESRRHRGAGTTSKAAQEAADRIAGQQARDRPRFSSPDRRGATSRRRRSVMVVPGGPRAPRSRSAKVMPPGPRLRMKWREAGAYEDQRYKAAFPRTEKGRRCRHRGPQRLPGTAPDSPGMGRPGAGPGKT
jgi:hypothetical protein